MYKVDLDFEIKNIKGESLVTVPDKKTTQLKDVLPEAILAYKQEGNMRKLNLARKCSKDGKISLEQADITILKKAIENLQLYKYDSLNSLVGGGIEEYLESLKQEVEKEDKK